MIPITSFVNLINFIVPIILSVRIYKVYKIKKSDLLFYFSAACFFFSFYWLISGLFGIVINNLNVISILNVFKFIFLYLSLVFIIKIPFNLIEQKVFGSIFSFAIIIGLVVFIVEGFLHFSSTQIVIIKPYIYWVPMLPYRIEIMTGVLSSIVLGIFIATFIYLLWRDWGNTTIVRRSFYIIVGMGVMMIGGILRFFAFNILVFYAIYAFSNIFVSIGLLIIADGILHEHKQISVKDISDIKNEF